MGWCIRSLTYNEELESLDDDERFGAIAIPYRDGGIVVRLNLLGRPPDFLRRPLTKNPILRWLIARGWWTGQWQVHAEYQGAGMWTNDWSRSAGVKYAKHWIDEMIVKKNTP